jgi:hypothetical protein
MSGCLLGLEDCSQLAQCPTLDFWTRMQKEIAQELGRITLADVIGPNQPTTTRNNQQDLTGVIHDELSSIGSAAVGQKKLFPAGNVCVCGGGI